MFDPANVSWTDLSVPASGTPPAARNSHGFAAEGGLLYVHGGNGDFGIGPLGFIVVPLPRD